MSTRTAELVLNIQKGILDPTDVAFLEQTPAQQLIQELQSSFPLTFQERQIGVKWELALARACRPELVRRSRSHPPFVQFMLVPTYRNCLMLSGEGESITGISRLTRLTVWPVRKPEPGLALRSGQGFKLDRLPDGWSIKPMHRRTVKLAEAFLRQRGWRFDHLQQVVPIA